jgi:hypothetical protein
VAQYHARTSVLILLSFAFGQVEERLEALESTMKLVILFDEFRPFRMLGFETSAEQLASLATAFASFFFSIVVPIVGKRLA